MHLQHTLCRAATHAYHYSLFNILNERQSFSETVSKVYMYNKCVENIKNNRTIIILLWKIIFKAMKHIYCILMLA